ncbi:MAG: hypothetical protein R3232_10200, partial [Clostridia bacterium]|nr:hypothetical protein [Clostridia bacterium]
ESRDEGIFILAGISGTAPLEKIEIVRNGEIIHSRHPDGLDFELNYIDETPAEPGTYYYIKAVQVDGEMAWSSPVWVDYE